MKELIELAQKIEDNSLRNKVIEFLKNPKLSNPNFEKYKPEKIEKVRTPFSSGSLIVDRDVLNHTIAVAKACISIANVVEETYGIMLNKDYLLAGAILHDLGKLFEWKMTNQIPEHTGILLDHTILITSELYKRDFPEEVIHMVASHFGETGPTPPRTLEAHILAYVDNLLSVFEWKVGSIFGNLQTETKKG